MKINSPSFLALLLMLLSTAFISCDDDAPPAENEEEVIAKAVLTFTPISTGETLTFTYTDPVGAGQPNIEPIVLKQNTPYRLSIQLLGPNGENISDEIDAEAAEHMFFFGWPEGLFSRPTGNGNLDSREENAVIYLDTDIAGLPLGLITEWHTAGVTTTANNLFRIVLKHQPGSKSATSTVDTGATDFDVAWPISIVE